MRFLSLAALQVALADLFSNRLDALHACNAGKTYEPMLRKKQHAIDALPEAHGDGKPFADALTQADTTYDGFGGAIWHLTEAYLRWPTIPADVRAAITRVRSAFVPQLEVLQASYVNEANAAMGHKQDLITLEADLKMIPIAQGLSLHDWCMGFVAAGESIASLLGDRANAQLKSRAEAGKLRTSTIALLGRLRAAIADEVAEDETLPRDLEKRIFAYFDELSNMRGDALAARKEPTTEG